MGTSAAKESVVVSNPRVLSGVPVFRGTRVPVRTLIDHIKAGDSIEVFLTDFPTVSREDVLAFLDEVTETIT